MTPEEIRRYGGVLGPAGCALVMWQYNATYMANPENRSAFKDIADKLASLPAKSCST
jgi:hypothetical protein